MIREVRVEGLAVSFQVVLTTPACPLKEHIERACITAIRHFVHPEAQIAITMTSRVAKSAAAATSAVLPHVQNIVVVASGKGGVGKSTIAANLALGLARSGARVGLLDADIYGPSVPIMFGLRNVQPEVKDVDGQHIIVPVERFGIKVLSIGLLVPEGQPIAWRGPMLSSALKQFLTEVEWGALDYLVVDTPPGTGDVHITLLGMVPVAGVVLVTTPQAVALADARKAAAMFRIQQLATPILGVVENMSWFSPAELPGSRYLLFGEGGGQTLATELQVPLLAQVPLVQAMREHGDDGTPTLALPEQSNAAADALLLMASHVAQQLSIANAKAPVAEQPLAH